MENLYKNKNFVILILTSTIKALMSSFLAFTLPILIYDMTSSVLAMSTMRAVEFIPNLILAIFIGVYVDRFKRKNMLIMATVVQIGCIIVIILLIYFNLIHLAVLYVLAFLIFCTNYMKGNASYSLLPNVIKHQQLNDANAKFSFYGTLSGIIGPSLAGIIYALYGPEMNILIYLAGLFLTLVLMLFLKVEEEVERSGKNIKGDIADGWHALTENEDLWNLTIIILLVNLGSSITGAVMLFFALDTVEITEIQLGYILTAASIGALAGAQSVKLLGRILMKGHIFILAFLISLSGYLLLWMSFHWILLLAANFLIGMAVILINVPYLSLRQSTTPNHLLGRVAGTSSMIMKLSMPFAYLITGIVGEMVNVRYMFIVTIVIIMFVVVYALKNKIHKMK
ncbi:MFS transporter [Salinicoccus sp. YB14-2]|uniref:MFS transporter n=1 Tax=Salinicoccus sp. YB14-2 TaxID=1572701 RepID=UPI000689E951|nr:MFS transporter [Salinicoccus sp. YB14-2]